MTDPKQPKKEKEKKRKAAASCRLLSKFKEQTGTGNVTVHDFSWQQLNVIDIN